MTIAIFCLFIPHASKNDFAKLWAGSNTPGTNDRLKLTTRQPFKTVLTRKFVQKERNLNIQKRNNGTSRGSHSFHCFWDKWQESKNIHQ